MKEKIRIVVSFLIVIFLFPYVMTVFMQGTTVEGESVGEDATEALSVEESTEEENTGDLLTSILAKEISVNSEEEAIKAQAVIVRANYLYAQAKGEATEEGLSVQEMMEVFGEKNFSHLYQELADCIAETEHVTVSYEGNQVSLPYHAVSAGKTRSAQEAYEGTAFPYLVSVDSTFDIPSEDYLKVVYFEKTEFLAQLEQIFQGVTFSEEDILSQLTINARDSADYVLSITAGNVTVSGEDFRNVLGLNSACFSMAEADGKIRIVTKGLGHGFGLSQCGANELAKEGKTYIEILKYYFPNIEITE